MLMFEKKMGGVGWGDVLFIYGLDIWGTVHILSYCSWKNSYQHFRNEHTSCQS